MTPLSSISLFMLDMDGTIYLGNRLFPCTIPFLNCVKEQGKRFLFLTNNSSKNRLAYVGKLSKMGIAVEPDDVFTSGEATTIYMRKAYPGARVFVMGMPTLEEEFREAGFEVVRDKPDCLVLGFDQFFDYEKMTLLCNLVRSGIPYIATHPDFNCPVENGFIPDIGAMIAYVQAATGRLPDKVVGKPHAGIAQAVMEKYGVEASGLAMVGDRLYTDIALGAEAGITSILVFSGETTREDYAKSDVRADYCFEDLSGITDALRSGNLVK
ncbi:MAG: HAD-IIA family hydrolase [Kiritimatiellae bacterium]|nr:HAD-IIA family hydrolase [Kiritimatiellia bacterium]